MLKKLKKYLTSPRFIGSGLNVLAYILPRVAGSIAFRLFCTPLKGKKFTDKEERFLSSAHQEKMPLRDFEIHLYHWKDSEETVLLAHGWDSHAARWRGLVPVLQKAGLSIVALDAPAHGRSGSKISHGILYAEAIEKAVAIYKPDYVIGHSFGGMAAAYYFSQEKAQAIKKLILLGTPSRLTTIMANFNRILGLNTQAQKSTASYFKKKLGFGVEYFSVENFIQKAEVSGLVMHDVADEVAPISEARAIQENWQGSQLFTTSGLGHSMQAGSVFKKMLAEFTNS